MSVLRELITEFAIFSTPSPKQDDEQLTMGNDIAVDPDSQDEIDFSVDNKDGENFGDDHPEHDAATCTCPCHDKEKEGSFDDENIEVIEPDEGDEDENHEDDENPEGNFSLDDKDEDEDSPTKYKFF